MARLLLSLFVLSIAAFELAAQSEKGAEDSLEPEAPIIRKLVINFTGLSNVNEEVARANMSLREGVPYNKVTVDRDIRSLYRSNLFEYIEARLAAVGENEVDVIFDIRPKFRISAILFEGNDRVSDNRLDDEIKIVVNQTLNEPRVKSSTEKLREYYLKKGFSQARIDYRIDRSPGTGYGTVTFVIREGKKFKIKKVAFEGNGKLKSRRLRKKMDTKKRGVFSFLTGKGRFDQDKFEDDLETLKDEYRKEGYLDIDIDPSNVTFSYPAANRMRIDISVDEGKRYRVGSISFEGNDNYEGETLKLLLRVVPGSIYYPEKIDEDVEHIEDFYGKFGYMETRVRMHRVPNVKTGDIDLKYAIRESDQFKVESIDIEGNTKTKSVVILRELALSPGSTFDSVRMEASRMRLENTRYFEDTNVTDQSTNIPQRKDLRITFKEGRTGNFSFGAGFSSLDKGVFFIELTQSNFDLFNWRGAFQGDGQKFRIKAQLGGRSSSLVLHFEEPWLFEKRLAFGIQVFNQSTNYDNQRFDSTVQGFEVSLRKRLFELIEGRIAYNLSERDFGSFKDASEQVRLNRSVGVVSRVNLLLLRDTRDRILNTFRGARYELDLSYAGDFLGGDFDFTKIESRNAFYLPLSRKFTQTVEFLFRAGVVDETNENSLVPYEERFFLGGPNTLRGFQFRDISPNEFGTHFGRPPVRIGGKTYGMFGAEYSFGIVKDFRIAAFYDGGFVNKVAGDFGLKRSRQFYEFEGVRYWAGQRRSGWQDNYGFGVRLSLMGTPLRLDYAIPITTEGPVADGGNDDGAQFNFTFGGRF